MISTSADLDYASDAVMEQWQWLIAQIGKYEITFAGNIRLYLLEIWNYVCGNIKLCEWLIAQTDKYEITFVGNVTVFAEIWSHLLSSFWTHALTFNFNSGFNPIPLLKSTILHL